MTSATGKAINVRGQRYFVVRDDFTPYELAEWTNAVQELAGNSRHPGRLSSQDIAKEWRAGGIHKLYGYMADLASEPR